MSRALVVCAWLVSTAAIAAGCATPPDGCDKSICPTYAGISPSSLSLNANKTDPSTWTGALTKIGYFQGVYNKKVNGGVYPGFAKAKGTPSLNYEKFHVQGSTTVVDQAYVIYSVPGLTSLATCCDWCRKYDKCQIYQYVPTSLTSTAGSCYLLSGGSYKGENPYGGSPYSGSRSEQASATYSSVTASFVGGWCNPAAGVTDDPHFTGAHGTHFDFNGELDKSFCLLTDRSLHINAVLRGYRSDNAVGATRAKDGKAIRSWIREVGLLFTDSQGVAHTLHLTARAGKQQERGSGFLATSSLDGTPFSAPSAVGASFHAGDLTLTFLGTAKKGPYDVDRYSLTVGDALDLGISMRVAHPLLQTPTDAQAHFNLVFNDVRVTDGVHGVLGQTYRSTAAQAAKAVRYSELSRLLGEPVKADGESGRGFLEGTVQDYESSHVLKPDCKVSSFSQ